jgi:hypothetical protein
MPFGSLADSEFTELERTVTIPLQTLWKISAWRTSSSRERLAPSQFDSRLSVVSPARTTVLVTLVGSP